jgi:hypothetical protein
VGRSVPIRHFRSSIKVSLDPIEIRRARDEIEQEIYLKETGDGATNNPNAKAEAETTFTGIDEGRDQTLGFDTSTRLHVPELKTSGDLVTAIESTKTANVSPLKRGTTDLARVVESTTWSQPPVGEWVINPNKDSRHKYVFRSALGEQTHELPVVRDLMRGHSRDSGVWSLVGSPEFRARLVAFDSPAWIQLLEVMSSGPRRDIPIATGGRTAERCHRRTIPLPLSFGSHSRARL